MEKLCSASFTSLELQSHGDGTDLFIRLLVYRANRVNDNCTMGKVSEEERKVIHLAVMKSQVWQARVIIFVFVIL